MHRSLARRECLGDENFPKWVEACEYPDQCNTFVSRRNSLLVAWYSSAQCTAMPLRHPLQDPAGDDEAQYRNGTSSSSRLSLGLPRSKLPKPAPPSPNGPSSLDLRRRNEDDSIRSTDHDALSSRLSAMKAGYLAEEPWTELLYAGLNSGALSSGALSSGVNPPSILRRPPVINIGTNLRCRSLDAVVETFIANCDGNAQIVSLGAGSDARYWRFSKDLVDGKIARYLELDFPATVATKIAAIQKAAALKSTLGDIININMDDSQAPSLETPNYTLAGCDLRHLDALKARLTCLDSRRPTLILAECLLSYMPPHTSHDVIRTISEYVDSNVDVAAVSYEMCVAGDSHEAREVTEHNIGKFGKIMLRNLEVREVQRDPSIVALDWRICSGAPWLTRLLSHRREDCLYWALGQV